MKLVSFIRNGATHIGALVDDSIVDLNEAVPGLPTEMNEFLAGGEANLAKAKAALGGATIPLSSVKLLSPIPHPGKILCIGLNYKDHAEETGSALPEFPIVFAKYDNTVIAHGDTVILPKVSSKPDYEAELGFVIGKTAKNVSEADALSYVAGYLPVNDVSARDYQNRTSQWTMGKTFDTFAPMGPALTTADEVPDPHNLSIKLTIGDETLQNSSTSQLIFKISALIASISEVMTLNPGDVVSTGTPPGVGMARKPPRWLKDGDVCSITIEGLGTLTNPIAAEK